VTTSPTRNAGMRVRIRVFMVKTVVSKTS
jgi:hypothetical protein